MKAVILAGGRGKRLGKVTDKIQKTMIRIDDLPILHHQINLLKKYGIKDIIILTAYRFPDVKNYFKDGKKFGVKIQYFNESDKISTTGERFKEIENILKKDFLVLYGDVMVNMNIRNLIYFHKNKKSDCTIVAHPNDHPQDSDLLEIDSDKRIVAFHPKPHKKNEYFKNLVNACFYIMSPKLLKHIKKGEKSDFGRDIFPKILKKEKIYVYQTIEYLKDMGTKRRLREVINDYKSGKIKKFNKEIKRKAIFLDRDGVINKAVHLLHKIEDFELLPGVAKAIRKINDSDFLAIVVTNQPQVAKGLCEIKETEEIHKKMETLLARERAKLDAIYYCPHHPDRENFPNGNKKYQIVCGCRKPKIGMIKRAEKDFNIDLKNSYLIGDFDWDILAGKKAGLKTIGVGNNFKDSKIKPDYLFYNLEKAINFILK